LALPSSSSCIAWLLGFCSPKFYSFISFAPPKETNQRKGGRKVQLQLFWAPATQGLEGTTKKAEVRTLSGLSTRRYLNVYYLNIAFQSL
jgi:hypothetical protein